MNIRLARRENADLKSLNEFLGLKFKVNNRGARDVDGQRSWEDDYMGFEIVRTSEEVPNIAHRKQSTTVYTLGYMATTYGGYMDPPETDYVELASCKTLADALFHAHMHKKKWEWENMLDSQMEIG